ncbi:serum response factor-binding protein 1 isoform X1 [Chiloscyllium plagiosum]|uniref:serum response factor-binding protein 1 isoform X1 n=2 Tax=Chiloscyllium plagiosum TaxID=36176 RepID=UPI001CB86059|nr:serum response factor-binding protein 1 isoform X1 [Chiloscyllium plagiosum]XP_043567529.1 serum response factor-binding protein 1 isoform X1 [Chiloscyllium plagiosum]
MASAAAAAAAEVAPVNVNNEVVKLRKDVKKARTLIIRKLTRKMVQLKAKKGTEDLILKNLRRAERLLDEIHIMKDLKPDYISKTALQRNLNFEIVCKKPKSTVAERAVARIASHPLISRKIEAIKVAVTSFKEARQKAKRQRLCSTPHLQTESLKQTSPEESKLDEMNEIKEDDNASERIKNIASKPVSATVKTSDTKALHNDTTSETPAAEITLTGQHSEESKPQGKIKAFTKYENTKAVEVNASDPDVSTVPGVSHRSDVSSEDEKYFDDSTEERYYNQTSSDDSGDDDFFIGKVKRISKKNQELDPTLEANTLKDDEEIMPNVMKKGKNDPMGCDGKNNNSPKTTFGSLFCNNLSDSKILKQKSNFQGNVKKKQSDVTRRKSQNKILPFRGRSSGRSNVVFPKPQQSLHPSWEASKRQKEQSKIIAFQGKKIKFDD